MATRAEQLAAQFEAVNDEVIRAGEGCTDDEWRRLSASDGRPVGVLAHHIAEVQGAFTRLVGKLVAGETYSPTTSLEEIHASNAQHARDYANVGKAETLDLQRQSGTTLARQLRGLSDGQLDGIAGVFGGHELHVAQAVEWIVIGHAREHLASLRATIGS